MKRALLSAVLALIILASPAASQPPSIIEQAHRSVVAVSAPNNDPSQTLFCTGVIIGIVRVLTAEHCIPDDNNNVFVDGKLTRVVKKSEWLALLDTPITTGRIIEIAAHNPPLGADATTIGYVDMAGTRLTLKRAVAGWMDGNLRMFIDGPLVSGMSGGPVIDEKGRLIGINQATNAWTGMISSVKEIREFIK